MPPKPKTCEVCDAQASKYRCSACPVRYCSVACFKAHKAAAHPSTEPAPAPAPPAESAPAASPALPSPLDPAHEPAPEAPALPAPLRPLTSLAWPPEPDEAIFTDPLARDDPKPLRRSELERLATSAPLRALLAAPAVPRVLRALDAMPSAPARAAALSRLLGVDAAGLARPAALAEAEPPRLEELLRAAAGEPAGTAHEETDGWWLGRGGERVWIGAQESALMRQWAGVVVAAIDGDGRGDEWGSGDLGWDV